MKESINSFAKTNISDIRRINRDLTERALRMRCEGFLAQAKARLLSETIFEIDQSKKVLLNSQTKLRQQNDKILLQKAKLEKVLQVLTRSNEHLKSFAQVASHDLRSPLTNIRLNAEILGLDYGDVLDDNAVTCLDAIHTGVIQMTAMIDALLDQSKMEDQETILLPVDMNDLVDEQIVIHQSAIEESSASITHEKLPIVMGERNQLGRLIQNLLSNALKYRAKERLPVISIAANRDGGEWQFSFRDNGRGIDPTDFDRVFEMFYRAARSSEMEGTGIGLAACSRIMEQHGGRIWVDSAVGRGSTFFFTLPNSE